MRRDESGMAKRKMSTFRRLKTGQMNRSQRRELGRRVVARDPGVMIVHPDAGGIAVGNESHFVAVPSDGDANPVREFWRLDGCPERDGGMDESCRIDTGAMQATGVYWIAQYDVLELHGIRVLLASDSHLGPRYRDLRGRLPTFKAAVKAMARYLAVLIYRLLTKGEACMDRGAAQFE